MFSIRFEKEALRELDELRASERARIVEEADEQLSREPLRENRRRKVLRGLVPPWDQLGPVRQLSFGDFRVFYDVDEVKKEVVVRAVRYKTPHMTTEEIL